MAEDLIKKIQGIRTFRGKILHAWARRADERPDFRTKKNESVRTASGEHKGKEILFPTIRMRGPGLEHMKGKEGFDRAKKEAIKRKDYITFDTPKEADAWSKSFSRNVGKIK